MYSLVVTTEFVCTASGIFHHIGTVIEDFEEITSILASPQVAYVTRIAADEDDAPVEQLAEKHEEINHDPDAVR